MRELTKGDPMVKLLRAKTSNATGLIATTIQGKLQHVELAPTGAVRPSLRTGFGRTVRWFPAHPSKPN